MMVNFHVDFSSQSRFNFNAFVHYIDAQRTYSTFTSTYMLVCAHFFCFSQSQQFEYKSNRRACTIFDAKII